VAMVLASFHTSLFDTSLFSGEFRVSIGRLIVVFLARIPTKQQTWAQSPSSKNHMLGVL
jgi:hypothetical protein